MGKMTQLAIALLLGALLACSLYFIFSEHVVGKHSHTLLGYSVAVVASGSMESVLATGDMILNPCSERL